MKEASPLLFRRRSLG